MRAASKHRDPVAFNAHRSVYKIIFCRMQLRYLEADPRTAYKFTGTLGKRQSALYRNPPAHQGVLRSRAVQSRGGH